jgi:Mrp family chromosome partitioning ATPase
MTSARPQPEVDLDAVERLRSLESPDYSPRASTVDQDPAITKAAIRPEVMDACSIALRRMGGVDRSVAVTSASRREGRTTVAIGLAAASAIQHNRATILLDLDFERGTVGRQTSLRSTPGVADFLRGDASADECVQRTSDRLAIITAGALRDYTELAARMERLSDLMTQLEEHSEVLIADLPPLSSGIMAASIADLFESVALVVRAGRVSIPHIEKSVSVLTQRPFVILNAEAAQRSSRIRRTLDNIRP